MVSGGLPAPSGKHVRQSSAGPPRCGRRDLNPHGPCPPAPKAGASTDSATPAQPRDSRRPRPLCRRLGHPHAQWTSVLRTSHRRTTGSPAPVGRWRGASGECAETGNISRFLHIDRLRAAASGASCVTRTPWPGVWRSRAAGSPRAPDRRGAARRARAAPPLRSQFFAPTNSPIRATDARRAIDTLRSFMRRASRE